VKISCLRVKVTSFWYLELGVTVCVLGFEIRV